MMILLANPDAALLTLLAGIGLIYFEANRPGLILPGCLGALLILLSLFAISQLRVQPMALLGLAASVVLTVAGIFRPSLNLFAAAGALTQAWAWSVFFAPARRPHPGIAFVFAAGFCFSTAWLGRVALLARRNKRQTTATRTALGLPKVDSKHTFQG